MIRLIKALRPAECVLATLLGHIGFVQAGVEVDPPVLAAIFVSMAATMLQNDWRDRFHDLAKGKTFAITHPTLYLSWLTFVWVLCGGLLIWLFRQHPLAVVVPLWMALVGAVYSELRQTPLASVVLVSFTAVSPLLAPMSYGASLLSVAPLYLAAALIMFGRETLHDIADMDVDRGYKKTLPLLHGEESARMAATSALVLGCCVLVYITPAALVGTAFVFWGLPRALSEPRVVVARKRTDIGMMCLAIALIFF